MKTCKTLAVLAAACLAASVHAAPSPLAGTVITGLISGPSSQLLGLDHNFADEPGTNTTALSALELEFISANGALGVDFFADGRVQVYNNTGEALLAGSYTLTFSLAGLSQPLTALVLADDRELTGGSYSLQLLGPDSFSLRLDNLSFSGEFGSFTAQVASTVPEPASLALVGAGLGLLAGRRVRRPA